MTHPLALKILAVLSELDERTLFDCYGIKRTDSDNAPLDLAILAWFDAGCPTEPERPVVDQQEVVAFEAARLSVEADPRFQKLRVQELTIFCFGRTDEQCNDLALSLVDRAVDSDALWELCDPRWAEVCEVEELEGEIDED